MEFKHIVFDHDGTLMEPENLVLFEGVKELLDLLKQNQVKLYVWTARSRASTINCLKEAGIIHYFEELRTATDGEDKPAIAGLEYLVGGISKKEIAIVGDSFSDMIGATNFKVTGLGANWLDKSAEHEAVLKHFGAKAVFNTVEDLKKYLKI